MKYLNKYCLMPMMSLLLLVSCEPKDNELEDNDIVYLKSDITGFSPNRGEIGTQVTLTGVRMDDENLKVYIGSTECKIISQAANQAVIELPRVIKTDYFTTINSLSARAVSTNKFEVSYPQTTIDESSLNDTIFKSGSYVITGTNLDLVTEVILSDTVITIDGTNAKVATPTKLTIAMKESNPLKPKIKGMAGNLLPEKSKIVVLETYPSANLVVIDPKIASPGDTVKFIFDNFTNAQLIKQIKVGGKVAIFSLNEPYIMVTIPGDAADGAIEIVNAYGVKLKYTNGQFLTLAK